MRTGHGACVHGVDGHRRRLPRARNKGLGHPDRHIDRRTLGRVGRRHGTHQRRKRKELGGTRLVARVQQQRRHILEAFRVLRRPYEDEAHAVKIDASDVGLHTLDAPLCKAFRQRPHLSLTLAMGRPVVQVDVLEALYVALALEPNVDGIELLQRELLELEVRDEERLHTQGSRNTRVVDPAPHAVLGRQQPVVRHGPRVLDAIGRRGGFRHEAEVDDLGRAAGVHDDVVGLEVLVDEAFTDQKPDALEARQQRTHDVPKADAILALCEPRVEGGAAVGQRDHRVLGPGGAERAGNQLTRIFASFGRLGLDHGVGDVALLGRVQEVLLLGVDRPDALRHLPLNLAIVVGLEDLRYLG